MLSLVIPLYNEQNRFDLEAWSALIQEVDDCRWFFVDDGSTDSTASILTQLQFDNVQIETLKINVGKGEAVRNGLLRACTFGDNLEGELVGYLDCDGAFDFSEIPEIINSAKSKLLDGRYSLVIASRVKLGGRKLERNPVRHYLGRIIATYVCLGWPNAPYDTQSGFKVLRLGNNYSSILEKPFVTRWFFDIELMIRMEKLNYFFPWELTVNCWRDVKGSKLKASHFVNVFLRCFEYAE
jgi:glycosyltransferase involved in cell wall biosynthesis